MPATAVTQAWANIPRLPGSLYPAQERALWSEGLTAENGVLPPLDQQLLQCLELPSTRMHWSLSELEGQGRPQGCFLCHVGVLRSFLTFLEHDKCVSLKLPWPANGPSHSILWTLLCSLLFLLSTGKVLVFANMLGKEPGECLRDHL